MTASNTAELAAVGLAIQHLLNMHNSGSVVIRTNSRGFMLQLEDEDRARPIV